jgi:hypothetical protein
MANMGYCRFQNTLQDLRDCYQHMDDDLSDAEKAARYRLLNLCNTIANEFVVDGQPVFHKE